MHKYKISVIIPIYNSEDHIKETIDSVINQSIGFEDNIQLILINDGSKDGSEQICLSYQKKYPKNIVYKYQTNAGASSARNYGREFVEGKYFNFLDSDDKWSLNAFEEIYNFFEKHYDEIDVINARTVIIGDMVYNHPLDFKFKKGNRIIDLEKDYDYIQMGSAPCVYKTEAVKDIFQDTKLFVAEDTKFMCEILSKKQKYGILASAEYYYRRELNGNSLSNKSMEKIEWYTNVIDHCHLDLINYSKQNYGHVLKFIQYTLLYEIQYRIYKNDIIDKVLTKKEIANYKNKIFEILNNIDDEIILNFNRRKKLFKIYLLKLKYKKDIMKKIKFSKGKFLFNDNEIYNTNSKHIISLNVFEIKKDKIIIEGLCGNIYSLISDKNNDFYIRINGEKKYKLNYKEREYDNMHSFCNEIIVNSTMYYCQIPLNGVKSIEFVIKLGDKEVIISPSFERFSGLSNKMGNYSYRVLAQKIIRKKQKKLLLSKYNIFSHIKCEILFMLKLLKLKQVKIIAYRILYYLNKIFYKKTIWLVRDKYEKAGDNGESIFKYISNWKDKNKYNTYFVLRNDSKDYNRVSKYGKIIDPRSKKYKILFLLSDKIIDSTAIASSINPFNKKCQYYRDLFKFDYIGLFHGIGQRDMSSWTNKFNYNCKIYVSGAKKEYDSMLLENNGYGKDVIKLTGLPRFDELRNKDEKIVVFMPTWRKNLAGRILPNSNKRAYSNSFKRSEYCKFYNDLINNKQLLSVMKKLGYKGVFYNHPNFAQQYEDFKGNDIIKVSKDSANANEVISNCSMLITDYSSAFFECAYLNKPVVYTQFDSDTFVQSHTGTKGYFSYKKDNFGPVCYNLDDSVKAIINYLEKGCINDKKYETKIKKFFIYRDKKNSKRLVDEIVKYDRIK